MLHPLRALKAYVTTSTALVLDKELQVELGKNPGGPTSNAASLSVRIVQQIVANHQHTVVMEHARLNLKEVLVAFMSVAYANNPPFVATWQPSKCLLATYLIMELPQFMVFASFLRLHLDGVRESDREATIMVMATAYGRESSIP